MLVPSSVQRQAAAVTGPVQGSVTVVAVSSTAAAVDLTAYAGKLVTVKAEGCRVFYMLATTSALADDLDDTQVAGNNRCASLEAGENTPMLVELGAPFLGYKSAGADTGKLRIHVSSPAANE